MPRRIVAIAAAVAGIWLLAGLGWALLTLGVLVEVGCPRGASPWIETAIDRLRRHGGVLWAKAKGIPQQIGAVTSAGSGMALVPLGVGLFAGVGPALVVLGVLALGLGLLLDRTA
jgi:hypothetical protein